MLNLHDIISTETSPPPTHITDDTTKIVSPNPAYLAWYQKDQMLFAWILSSISEDCYQHLTTVTNSAEAWKALATAYGVVSNAQRTQLLLELHSLSKDDKSVSQYLHQAKSLADSLAIAGNPLSESDFNAIVFRKLGSDYNGIMGALQQRTDPVTFSELHGQLVSYEILLNSQQVSAPLANTVHTSGSHSQSSSRGFYSAYRGRGGRNGNRGRRGYNNSRPACQICGLNNHIASTCRRRFDSTFQPRSQNFNRSNMDFSGTAQGHLSVLPPPSMPDSQISSHSQYWYPDTGATHHVTPDLASLSLSTPYRGTNKLVVGNGTGLNIAHVGSGILPNTSRPLHLNNILHVPHIQKPLLSVQKLCKDNNCSVEFNAHNCFVKDPVTKKIILRGTSDGGLYKLFDTPVFTSSPVSAYLSTLEDWHARLGHPNYQTLRNLVNKFQLSCKKGQPKTDQCHACCLGKLHRLSLPLTHSRSRFPLELIHSDV